jgi:enoyl reductase
VIANIPPHDLAEFALSMMTLPVPTFQLSPQAKSYVNLPTFLTGVTGIGERDVTAALPGESVTVTATTSSTNPITTLTTPNGTPYTNCGLNGTRESSAQINAAGAGAVPDCGVVYQQPSTQYAQGYPLSVSVTWDVAWQETVGGNAGGQFPAIPMPSAQVNVPVAEIQSINGGG